MMIACIQAKKDGRLPLFELRQPVQIWVLLGHIVQKAKPTSHTGRMPLYMGFTTAALPLGKGQCITREALDIRTHCFHTGLCHGCTYSKSFVGGGGCSTTVTLTEKVQCIVALQLQLGTCQGEVSPPTRGGGEKKVPDTTLKKFEGVQTPTHPPSAPCSPLGSPLRAGGGGGCRGAKGGARHGGGAAGGAF
jgi:hypothetical protein